MVISLDVEVMWEQEDDGFFYRRKQTQASWDRARGRPEAGPRRYSATEANCGSSRSSAIWDVVVSRRSKMATLQAAMMAAPAA
jgi:hypothetical protein